jgi:hypothetical protein
MFDALLERIYESDASKALQERQGKNGHDSDIANSTRMTRSGRSRGIYLI